MERASVGEICARSNAARSSGRERWPWLRPCWISSSTWVVVASSSWACDVAVAVLGMRHLLPSLLRIGDALLLHHLGGAVG